MKDYRTPQAFKQALSERLSRDAQRTATPLQRLQLHFLFERLLVRTQDAFPNGQLKGGVALAIRLELHTQDTARSSPGIRLGENHQRPGSEPTGCGLWRRANPTPSQLPQGLRRLRAF